VATCGEGKGEKNDNGARTSKDQHKSEEQDYKYEWKDRRLGTCTRIEERHAPYSLCWTLLRSVSVERT
jgi:hypothetical protein